MDLMDSYHEVVVAKWAKKKGITSHVILIVPDKVDGSTDRLAGEQHVIYKPRAAPPHRFSHMTST